MDESNDRASVGSSSARGVRRARPRGGAARHIAARHGARLRPCASTARGHQLANKPDRRGNRPTEPRPPRQSNSAGLWAHAWKLARTASLRSVQAFLFSIDRAGASQAAGTARPRHSAAPARWRPVEGGGPAHALLQPRGRRRRGAGRGLDVQEDLQGWQRAGGAARLGHGLHAHAAQGPEEGARARARRIPHRAAFACSRRVRSRTRSRLTAGGGGSAVGAAATATSAAAATARGVGQRDVASGGLAGAA